MAEAPNYYHWILSYFGPHIGKRVLEVGAGTGTFSHFLLDHAPASELLLYEPAANLLPALAQRHAANSRVRIHGGNLKDLIPLETVDTVALVNVLEHIEDDRECLQNLHQLLSPGGSLLLFVPALPWLYGSLDTAFGHFRRYTRSELREKLESAGFQIVCLRYWNLTGVFSWFVAGKLLRRKTLLAADVRRYDRWVIPWCARMERLGEPPLGQNLLVIAKK